ncbi:AraC family transcriptional regulator [Streptomyces chengbuensis]|uniref:AraC family transcriptional regulator n=1 Tax=Streptomyces TaxID=1883 RepID=UPI0025B2D3FB|nr:AraC family transcriptional regulator [Streptomyces sp. HUAS CB01]WJY50231.1 AraC family transcriptional regulator [Streptomyces sp. HUAS CB01]
MGASRRCDVVRSTFSTPDVERGLESLATAYGTRIRMTRPAVDGAPCRYERRAVGPLALDSIAFPTDVSYDVEPVGPLMVLEVLSGGVTVDCDSVSSDSAVGDVMAPAQPGIPFHSHLDHARTRVAVIEPALLREVAGLGREESRTPLRLLRLQASAEPAHAAVWRSATRYVWDLFGAEGVAGTPLVLDAAVRMLAGAALAFFPNTYTAQDPLLRGPGHVGEVTMRRAVAYIDAHADGPLALSDIAAAAGVSARALQYGFRRHHGISPMGYLRRVRLERAHLELQAADRADGETVALIAARWGWGKPGNFSVAYRQAYGISPSTTLRNDGGLPTARS